MDGSSMISWAYKAANYSYQKITDYKNAKKQLKYLKFIKKVLCTHQGDLIEFHALGKKLHDDLDHAVQEGDVAKVREKFDAMDAFIRRGFYHAIFQCFAQAQHYYSNLRSVDTACLRFTVKLLGDAPGAIGEDVVTFAHSKDTNGVEGSRCRITENTAFKHIQTFGTAYVCQDIPVEAKKSGKYKYINPRLDDEKVAKYSRSLWDKLTLKEDIAWRDCWHPYAAGDMQSIEDCYKSTLVIPMTLRGNEVSDDFWGYFSRAFPMLPAQTKIGRTIFGFFCIDSSRRWAFNKESDIDMGYVWADIICLYWFCGCGYGAYSDTYKAAQNLIGSVN